MGEFGLSGDLSPDDLREGRAQVAKWLRRPNLKAEVKRALKRRTYKDKAAVPVPVPLMTDKQLRAELNRQARRL